MNDALHHSYAPDPTVATLRYNSLNYKMEGYLNVLESNGKIYLSLSNVPLPKREELSEARLINVTEESLQNIHIVEDTIVNSNLFYISTFGDNGFSLCLFPLKDYIIINNYVTKDIVRISKNIYAHREIQESLEKGETFNNLIYTIRRYEIKEKIKFIIRNYGIPLDEENIDPLISHVEAYQQDGSLVSLLEFGLKIQKNR
ncbi:hypothetical protein D3C87_887550 [compost metagenome]